jgi:hypothetical protein
MKNGRKKKKTFRVILLHRQTLFLSETYAIEPKIKVVKKTEKEGLPSVV